MSRSVKNLTRKYDDANDGPLSPTRRGRSFTTSCPSPFDKPSPAPRFNNHLKGQCNTKIGNDIGQTDIYFLRITYHVDIQEAKKIQSETGDVQGVTKKDWLSDDDFEELAHVLKLDDDNFDVCISAQQGTTTGYFKYCYDSGKPCIPVVEVNLYKDNKPYLDLEKMEKISSRWDNKFRIVAGPLPP